MMDDIIEMSMEEQRRFDRARKRFGVVFSFDGYFLIESIVIDDYLDYVAFSESSVY
jgi:hypothetical protein